MTEDIMTDHEIRAIRKEITQERIRLLRRRVRIQQEEIDGLYQELNCSVETNGQLQDRCNKMIDLIESGLNKMPDITLTEVGEFYNKEWKELAKAMIFTYRGMDHGI